MDRVQSFLRANSPWRSSQHLPSPRAHSSSPRSISTAASTGTSNATGSPPPRPNYGIWRCCWCAHETYFDICSGKHPIGELLCVCQHKPCLECNFSGSLEYFLPILEPLKVAIPNTGCGEEVPYGIVCGNCGLSWRAEEVREKKLGTNMGVGKLRKMPSLMKMGSSSTHGQKLSAHNSRLRKTKSMVNLGAAFRRDNNEKNTSPHLAGKEKKDEQEVQSTSLKFSGLKCTCGSSSDLKSTFCFKIAERNAELLKQTSQDESGRSASRYTNAELQAMGHDAQMLLIRHIVHPNPLRSNLVKPADIAMVQGPPRVRFVEPADRG